MKEKIDNSWVLLVKSDNYDCIPNTTQSSHRLTISREVFQWMVLPIYSLQGNWQRISCVAPSFFFYLWIYTLVSWKSVLPTILTIFLAPFAVSLSFIGDWSRKRKKIWIDSRSWSWLHLDLSTERKVTLYTRCISFWEQKLKALRFRSTSPWLSLYF